MNRFFVTIFLLFFVTNIGAQELLTNRYIAFGGNICDFAPQGIDASVTSAHFSSAVTNGKYTYAVDSVKMYKYNVFFQTLSVTDIAQSGIYQAAHIDAFVNCDTSINQFVLTQIHNTTNDTLKFRVFGTVKDTVITDLTAHRALGIYKSGDTLFYVEVKRNLTTDISFVFREFYLDMSDTTLKILKWSSTVAPVADFFPYSGVDTTIDLATISPQGDKMSMATADTVFLLDLDLQNKSASLDRVLDLDNVTGIAYAPGENFIYFTTSDGIVQYDYSANCMKRFMQDTAFSSVVLAPNGHVFATGSGQYSNLLVEILNPDLSTGNPDFAYKKSSLSAPAQCRMYYSSAEPWMDFDWNRTDITQNTLYFTSHNNRLPGLSSYRWYLNGSYLNSDANTTITLTEDGDNTVLLKTGFSQCAKDYDFTVTHLLRKLSDGFLGNDTIVCDTPFTIPLRIDYSNAEINWEYDYTERPDWKDKSVIYAKIPGIYSVEVILPDTTLLDTIFIRYADCPMLDSLAITLNGVALDEEGENRFCTGYGSGSFYAKLFYNQDYHCSDGVTIDWFLGGEKIGSGDGVFYQFTEPGVYQLFVTVSNSKRCAIARSYTLNISVDPVDGARSRKQITMLPNDKISITVGDNDTSTFYLRQMTWRDNNVISLDGCKITDLVDDGNVWSFSATVNPLIDNAYLVSGDEVTAYALIASDSVEYLSLKVTAPDGTQATFKQNETTAHPVMIGRPFYRRFSEPEEQDYYSYVFWNEGSSYSMNLVLGTSAYSLYRDKYVQRFTSMDLPHYDMVSGLTFRTPQPLDNLKYTDIKGEWRLDLEFVKTHNSVRMGSLKDVGLIFAPRFFRDTAEYEISWSSDPELTVDNVYDDIRNIRLYSSLPGTYSLNLTVKDNLGCVYKHGVDIYVLDRFYLNIPDAFTPNGDGINDTWNLSMAFASQLQSGESVKVLIWNKNGKIVANYDLQDNPLGWDGTTNGKPMPAGSYWFVIQLEDGKSFKGVLTLIR